MLDVIADFNNRSGEKFACADYGCELNLDEQKRRYALKSILRIDGLDLADYRSFFRSEVFADFPQLIQLLEEGLALEVSGRLRLTTLGLELSDVIGPWLCSAVVRAKMKGFALR